MNTIIKPCDGPGGDQAIGEAAAILAQGGLVAFPTETVYGLAADARDGDACRRVYAAKGRPQDNPLIIHIADLAQLEVLAADIPPAALALAKAFWPGPLTLVLRKTSAVPETVSGGLPTVAVRFPAHAAALKLIRAAGFPLAAPSANASGRPSPTLAAHVAQDLNGRIDMILDGGPCQIGLESTIVDVTTDPPCLLRPGGITLQSLEAVAGHISYTKNEGDGPPKAPGMKYKHYAPMADMTLVTGEQDAVARRIAALAAASPKKTGVLATDQTFEGYDRNRALVISAGDRNRPETIAAGLFAALRAFDQNGAEQVFAEGISEDGAGLAIMNRLKKAAGYQILKA